MEQGPNKKQEVKKKKEGRGKQGQGEKKGKL